MALSDPIRDRIHRSGFDGVQPTALDILVIFPCSDKDGGAEGVRTPDLLNAIQALSWQFPRKTDNR